MAAKDTREGEGADKAEDRHAGGQHAGGGGAGGEDAGSEGAGVRDAGRRTRRISTETQKRLLHRDQPFWAATPKITPPVAAAPSARHYDAIVIGAGISGALLAEALADGTRRVLVLDRRPPVRGSTLASTAMIQHEIDVPLHILARSLGPAAAERAWRRSVLAVERLAALTRRLGIDCAMTAKPALYLAGDSHGARALRTEAAARRSAGIAADYLTGAGLAERFGLQRTAAILSPASASANPAQLAAGLLAAAAARGAEIVSPLEVTDAAELGDGVALSTRSGQILTADHAIFCTGYEFLPQMQSPAHRIISTWALASEPWAKRPGWLDDMLVWEASDPYLYFRTAPGGRIIAGGEDENDPEAYRDPAKLRRKTAVIAEKLHDLAGIEIGKPAYRWAAPFGNTADGLPIIDRVPGCSRIHAVMGFGGNGITFSQIAAEILAARVAGRQDPDEGLFRFR